MGNSAPVTSVISIHALREESDGVLLLFDGLQMDFNPRPPRGERRELDFMSLDDGDISIHALREESDGNTALFVSKWFQFQSTPSARRATLDAGH